MDLPLKLKTNSVTVDCEYFRGLGSTIWLQLMVNIQFTCCLVIDQLLLCISVGGLGFSLHEIGIVLSVVGVLMFPVTLFTFPIVRTTAEKVVMHG